MFNSLRNLLESALGMHHGTPIQEPQRQPLPQFPYARQVAARPMWKPGTPIQPGGGVRTQQQIRQAPFKMFEDQTYQGNPYTMQAADPQTQFRFYEDNSFSPPAQLQDTVPGSIPVLGPQYLQNYVQVSPYRYY